MSATMPPAERKPFAAYADVKGHVLAAEPYIGFSAVRADSSR